VPPEKRIEYRVGIHLGDIVEESDCDLMGDGLNIAARLEGVGKPGCVYLSEDRVSASARQGQRRVCRPWRNATQEDRPAGANLRGQDRYGPLGALNPIGRKQARPAAPFDRGPSVRESDGRFRCLGVVQIYTNRPARGISELERALAIDRNLAAAHAYIGLAKNFVGRGEESAGHIENALRLRPRDTAVYLWRNFNGSVKVFLAKNKEAVGELSRAIEANLNFRPGISTSPSPWRNWSGLTKPASKRRRGFPSIPPSADIAAMRRATTL
jgi:hypothetical protein